MTLGVDLAARLARHRAAEAAGDSEATERALAEALAGIGWRAAGEDALDAVARDGSDVLRVGGSETVIVAELAELLRSHSPGFTDALPPVDAFVPAAREALRLYAAGYQHPAPEAPF